MNFIPKNKKHAKVFKYRSIQEKLIDHRTIELKYGDFGIKALSPGCITSKHFTMLQILIRRNLKKRGQFVFRKFPYTFTTKKPSEVRMGKGKGNLSHWVCPIKIGQIIIEYKFDLNKISHIEINKLLQKCMKRLPLKTCLINNYIK